MKKETSNLSENKAMQHEPLLATVDYPVVWQGKQYEAIDKFDCRVVGLKNELNGYGGYFTVIPISSKEYRENERETKAAVVITENAGWTLFSIYSDWGECYEMNIHNSLKKEIEFAETVAKEQGLLLNGA